MNRIEDLIREMKRLEAELREENEKLKNEG